MRLLSPHSRHGDRDLRRRSSRAHLRHQKINLHQAGNEITPNARAAGPGTADVCFVTDTPIDDVLATLGEFLVEIELGPMPQTGARGAMTSVYFRDPDENLVEIARYDDE